MRRTGVGTLLSVAAHAAVIAVMLHLSAHRVEKKADPPSVTLRLAPAPPPPPPLGGRAAHRTEPQKEPVHTKRDPLTLRPRPTQPTPPAPEPAPEPSGEPDGQPGGVPGGQPGGVPGGQPGGVPGGTGSVVVPAAPPPPPPSNVVLPFGEGMNRPQRIAGPEPVYPREAREAHVEGTMLVQCVITTEGTLEGCRVLKSLPFMDQPVLAALARQRYTPVTFQGRPVAVRYVMPFKFKLE
jgi:protein TonB